jgi:RHS repeat-associated protein
MTECFYTMNGQMMTYDSGGVTKDFLTDHLGSITAEIDQTQTRTYDTRYSAYGRNNWSTGTGCGFGWVGSYGYRETGLFHMSHYVRARHYSYVTGSWSTVDPLWPDESAYGYVAGRSSRTIDPAGTKDCLEAMKEAKGIACQVFGTKNGLDCATKCIEKCWKGKSAGARLNCLRTWCKSGGIIIHPKGHSGCEDACGYTTPGTGGTCSIGICQSSCNDCGTPCHATSERRDTVLHEALHCCETGGEVGDNTEDASDCTSRCLRKCKL